MSAHEVDVHVGERIRARRRALGVTQQQLADAIGLTFQQVQKYERGTNRVSASMLYAISAALKSPITHFFEGLPDPGSGEVEDLGPVRLVQRFLAAPDGLELAQWFPRIPQARIRRRILHLVQELAEPPEAGSPASAKGGARDLSGADKEKPRLSRGKLGGGRHRGGSLRLRR